MPPKRCGLYRTTIPREGIEADLLVYFHNHSEQGPPIVLLPEANKNNRWTFRDRGTLIEDEAYLKSLSALRSEGFYRVSQHFHPNDDEVVAQDSLVQLGYNRKAEPILFFPGSATDGNALLFPTQGMKVPQKVYDLLEPLVIRGPHRPRRLH